MSWLKKLKNGLKKSSSKLGGGISAIFKRQKLNEDLLEEIEDILITSDISYNIVEELIADLRKEKFDKEVTDAEVKQFLADKISLALNPVAKHLSPTNNTEVIMFVGVNGNGKTTSLGKLAAQYAQQGKKVAIAACDTFRAAAVEQLQEWAERSNCIFIQGKPQQDPASVAYEAYKQALSQDVDILLIDTAGRLQNNSNLMNELAKIRNVLTKIDQHAPHHTILVLDATTGQNAITQADKFGEIAGINAMIVTKLDGTAKGGIILSLAKKFALPIYAIGVGEGIDDLQSFDPQQFAKLLMGVE